MQLPRTTRTPEEHEAFTAQVDELRNLFANAIGTSAYGPDVILCAAMITVVGTLKWIGKSDPGAAVAVAAKYGDVLAGVGQEVHRQGMA